MGNNEYFDLGPAIRMGGRGHGHHHDACDWNGNDSCDCASAASAGKSAALEINGGECVEDETHVYYENCDSTREVTITSECHNEESLGRVMDVTMRLCNVCPGRRCAVGVHLTEMDENGSEYERGFRSITVPAHNYATNRDIELPSLRFVMPEDVSVAGNGCRRHFVVRTTNHYMEEPAACRRC